MLQNFVQEFRQTLIPELLCPKFVNAISYSKYYFISIVGIALTIATVVFLISNIYGIVAYDSEMEECISGINELMPTFDVNT